jgi:hypothetical protein
MTHRRPPRWVRVRGRRLSGVLFELDPDNCVIRIVRKAEVEEVDLRCFGLRPAHDPSAESRDNTKPPA